jgi:hypothetical protein
MRSDCSRTDEAFDVHEFLVSTPLRITFGGLAIDVAMVAAESRLPTSGIAFVLGVRRLLSSNAPSEKRTR